MANESLNHIVQHLRRIVERRGVGGLTDAQLLERFVADRDQAAFEVLVWRHGPMVLGVCRRIVRQEQNAEDAFQATFLALARKAGSLRGRDSLPGWLYRVASRIALHVRAAAAKRARRERSTEVPPETLVTEEPADVAARRELRAVLDEELLRLPRKYRRPLVLCDLQGKSHVQAARELGQAPGSMSRHLARARQLLQRRLTRRGVTLSVGVLADALAEEAAAATLAEMLVRPTVTAAALFARGGAVSGMIRGATVLLANSALRTMIVHKLRAVMVVLLMGLLCGGAGLLIHQGLAAKQVEEETARAESPEQPSAQPKAADGEKARVDRQGDPLPPGAFLRLGSVRLRHGAEVRRVVFSPDGKTLASAGDDRSVRIWDVKTGAELRRLGDHSDGAYALTFSADGKMLASADNGGTIYLWSARTGEKVRQFRVSSEDRYLQSLAFTPDGAMLASGSLPQTVRLWETATGKELRHWVVKPSHTKPGGIARKPPLPQGLPSLAFSADGKTLATGIAEGTVCFWEAATGKEIRRLTGPLPVNHCVVAFAPDGKTLAVSGDGFVRLLEATGRELRRLSPGGKSDRFFIHSLAFSPDGKMLALGANGYDVWLFETATGAGNRWLNSHCRPIWSVSFSLDGKTLASASIDHTIRLWDTARRKEILSFTGHRGLVSKAAFSPDGRRLATASYDRTVRLWDTATGAELRVLRGHKGNVNGVAFLPDGKRIVTAGADGDLRVWDAASGKSMGEFVHDREIPPISCLDMARDGQRLVIGAGGISLWDMAGRTEIRHFGGRQGTILKVAFSPNGKAVISVGGDQTIRLWDTATGNEIRRIGDTHGWLPGVAFSPDGKVLATGRDDGLIRLWDVATGKLVHELKGHRSKVSALAFAPDGKTLASSSSSGALRLWEIATGRERYHSPGHRAAVRDLVFSADGRLLASASSDSTALLWDMTGRDFVAASSGELSPQQLAALWKDLTGEDGVLAYRAVCTFCRVPKQAVPFLQKHMRQGENIPQERIAKLVRDLDDDAFKVRERASRELVEIGDLAEPALRNALEKGPSTELRRRVVSLLGALKDRPPSTERRQALRGTEVLERLATPEARHLLEMLAKGAPESPLTVEAKASLERLSQPSQALRGS